MKRDKLKKSKNKLTKNRLVNKKIEKEVLKNKRRKRRFRRIHDGHCELCREKAIKKIKVFETLDDQTVFLCQPCIDYLRIRMGIITKGKNLILATRNYVVFKINEMKVEYAKEKKRKEVLDSESRDLHIKRLMAKDNKWLPEQIKDGIFISVRNEVGQTKNIRVYGGYLNGCKATDVHAVYGVKYNTKFGKIVYFSVSFTGRFLGFIEQSDFDKVLKMPFSKLKAGSRSGAVPIKYKKVIEVCKSI